MYLWSGNYRRQLLWSEPDVHVWSGPSKLMAYTCNWSRLITEIPTAVNCLRQWALLQSTDSKQLCSDPMADICGVGSSQLANRGNCGVNVTLCSRQPTNFCRQQEWTLQYTGTWECSVQWTLWPTPTEQSVSCRVPHSNQWWWWTLWQTATGEGPFHSCLM